MNSQCRKHPEIKTPRSWLCCAVRVGTRQVPGCLLIPSCCPSEQTGCHFERLIEADKCQWLLWVSWKPIHFLCFIIFFLLVIAPENSLCLRRLYSVIDWYVGDRPRRPDQPFPGFLAKLSSWFSWAKKPERYPPLWPHSLWGCGRSCSRAWMKMFGDPCWHATPAWSDSSCRDRTVVSIWILVLTCQWGHRNKRQAT